MKLDKHKVSDIIGLTPTQEGILFHYLYAQNSEQYFEQTCLYVDGPLDMKIFEESWQQVIMANEMLRASFLWEKISKPVQVIWKQVDFKPAYTDISELPPAAQEQQVSRIKAQDKQTGFDLRQVPFRIHVVRLDSEKTLLIISAYSILYDGWSFSIILREFFDTYNARYDNRPPVLGAKTPFKEYVRQLQADKPGGEIAYWKQYLVGYRPIQLPLTLSTNANQPYALGSCSIAIDGNEAASLHALCREHKCNAASLFYTMWGILLQKLAQEQDITIGAVFSGRSLALKGIEHMVGNFLCTLPLRVKASPGDSLLSVLQAVAEDVVEKQAHEHTTLTHIREYSGLQGTLFDTLVIFENYPVSRSLLQEREILKVTGYTFEHASNYDVTVFVLQSPDKYELHFAYNRNRFAPGAVERIASYFMNIAAAFVRDIQAPVASVGLLSGPEMERIVYGFNNTGAFYNRDIILYDMLAPSFEKYAHRTAVQCNNSILTYKELKDRCDQLAADMMHRLGPEMRYVGILADRSVEMIVAVLAVIQAGYAYVPLDPNLPDKRLKQMLDNLSISCILITPGHQEKLDRITAPGNTAVLVYSLGEKTCVRTTMPSPGWHALMPAEKSVRPASAAGSIAYVIFTSGSTGQPKGVVVQHRPVVNIVEWINRTFAINENDRVLCVASLGFDLSVYDIFGILAKGGAIHVATYEDLASPALLAAKLLNERISVWNSAPPVLQNLVQWCEWNDFPGGGPALRLVLLSGDWIPLQLPEKVRNYFNQARVVSLGGATEATIWSNYYLIDEVNPEWNSIPYGKPVRNCTYYILDKDRNPCPVGITGDLYIGGECLSLGYINDIPLTRRKFVDNPFRKGEKMYDTGDLARWFDDGNIELIGRRDNQVKIRGFRIELGEIEHHLAKIPGIVQALVIANSRENGDKYLCAYYSSGKELSPQEIKDTLSLSLPAYMVPLHFIRITEIPVTANGKVDRAKLPLPETGRQEQVLPRSAIHNAVIDIWAEILGLSSGNIGADANFFELGGHSLNVTGLVASISRKYDINVQIRDVFVAPTVNGLTRLIGRCLLQSRQEIARAEEKAYYPLTPAQMSMYTFYESDRTGITYNISGGARLRGCLEISRVRETLQEITDTHESLRTSFHVVDGQVVQQVHPSCSCDVSILEAGRTEAQELIKDFIRPFDLSRVPLMRAAVIKVAEDDHYLILDMHHIIADGYSMKRIIQDFSRRYAGIEIEKPSLQYRDYSEYVNQPLYQHLLEPQQQYWREKLESGITRLHLPLDFERPAERTYEGRKVYFKIAGPHHQALNSLAREHQTTLYTVVLAVFKVMLARVCNEEQVIVGTPVAGRDLHSLAGTVGMFVNTLVLKSHPSGNKTFSSYLQELKQVMKEAHANSDLPFDYLARNFDKAVAPSSNPLFDVMFEYDDLRLRELAIDGLEGQVIDDLVKRAKFDITFEVIAGENELDCRFEYKTRLFRPETMEWLAERFMHVLHVVLENGDTGIGEINLHNELPAADENARQIVFNF